MQQIVNTTKKKKNSRMNKAIHKHLESIDKKGTTPFLVSFWFPYRYYILLIHFKKEKEKDKEDYSLTVLLLPSSPKRSAP